MDRQVSTHATARSLARSSPSSSTWRSSLRSSNGLPTYLRLAVRAAQDERLQPAGDAGAQDERVPPPRPTSTRETAIRELSSGAPLRGQALSKGRRQAASSPTAATVLPSIPRALAVGEKTSANAASGCSAPARQATSGSSATGETGDDAGLAPTEGLNGVASWTDRLPATTIDAGAELRVRNAFGQRTRDRLADRI